MDFCLFKRAPGRLTLASLAMVTCGMAVGPAGTASAGTAGTGQAAPRLAAVPRPQPGEWWIGKWGLQDRVWPRTQGAGVTVAVLDTGVQASVSDLRGAVVPGTVIGGTGDGERDTDVAGRGHGTEMASLIAGRGGTGIVGVAPQAKILPVQVSGVDDTGSFKADNGQSLTELADGITYAVNHGAGVINISAAAVSLASGLSYCGGVDSLQAAISDALAHNAVVVASSGNFSQEQGMPVVPAACAGVLTVGGVNQDGTWASGADTGSYVDVAAPFAQEAQCLNGQLCLPTGTSGAAALVSGEVALIKSRYPRMSWQEVVSRVTSEVVPGWPKDAPGKGQGYGIPDIAKAIDKSASPNETTDPVGVGMGYYELQLLPAGSLGEPQGVHVPQLAGMLGALVLLVAGIVLVAVFQTRARRRRNPGYGNPGYGSSGYGVPAGYSQGPAAYGQGPAGYGPVPAGPYPGMPAGPGGSGRGGVAVLIGGVVAVVAALIVGIASFVSLPRTPSLPQSALGASACDTSGSPGASGGSLTFTRPERVCGLPADAVQRDGQWITGEAAAQQDLLGSGTVAGDHATSRTYGSYATPYHLDIYRAVHFAGYTGTFSPKSTLDLLMLNDPGAKTVPAGPQGGVAACYQVIDLMHCAWATNTTAGEFWFYDQRSGSETVIGKSITVNFAKIRDVLEVAS